MLQIFFLNLYFTATTLKFHTYSLKFFGVQSKWLIKVFVFILFFFLIFFLSKFCARDFSNIIGPLYSKSLCTDDWTWSKLFGCFMLSLPVPIYLADFWNFLRPIVCSCKLKNYHIWIIFLGEVEDVHHVVIWRKLRNLLTSLWLENWVWTLSQNLHTFSSVSFYQLIICQNIYNKDDEEIKVLSNNNKKRGLDHLIRGQVTCNSFTNNL